ncbi:MAG: hypothetical protein EA411_02450 [Saprospirales bacterium]|nr:MAG: hypothetical protein EA411_02450 [Saprospirales bacterium]
MRFLGKKGILILLVVFGLNELAQGQGGTLGNRSNVHVGLEFSFLFQSEMLQDFDDTVLDSTGMYSFLTSSRNSLRFGGYLRFDLFGRHSLETGLYHVTRRYESIVSLESTGEELGRNRVRGVTFEVPLVWSVSIQTAENSFLSTGFGPVATYFVSDFGVFDLEFELDAFKRSRILPGVKANVGFEHDFGRSGGIYFGATFQHNFQSIAFMRMDYLKDGQSEAIGVVELNGSYFAAVVRYLFPMY